MSDKPIVRTVALLACAGVLTACGAAAAVSQPPSATSSARARQTYAPSGDAATAAFVKKYLDAVVAGRCDEARSMMLSPAVKDPYGRPSKDARSGNGLCGRPKTGQITIGGWRWGDSTFDASGGQVFTVALMFRVTSGHVGAKTSATSYAVPAGWSAYQLPMYIADSGSLYVSGAPSR